MNDYWEDHREEQATLFHAGAHNEGFKETHAVDDVTDIVDIQAPNDITILPWVSWSLNIFHIASLSNESNAFMKSVNLTYSGQFQ